MPVPSQDKLGRRIAVGRAFCIKIRGMMEAGAPIVQMG